MLSLEEKRNILNSFKELREKQDKFGRFFYYFDNSSSRKKIVAREFTESGNGYVFGPYIHECKDTLYKDGSVCVKHYTAERLKEIIRKSIDSLK